MRAAGRRNILARSSRCSAANSTSQKMRESATSFVQRAQLLLAALAFSPLAQEPLAESVGAYYRTTSADNRYRMLRRDIDHLRELGFLIDKSSTRPPIYSLNG